MLALLAATPACGLDAADVERRQLPIIGGEPSAAAQVVGLVFDGQPFCSGVLLDPWHVLTAAHCVEDPAGVSIVTSDPETAEPDAGATVVSITSVELHPQRRQPPQPVDMAVARLSSRAGRFLLRPEIEAIGPEDEGARVRLVGWGLTQRTQPASGGRRSGTATIREARPLKLVLSPDPATACIGDSGGAVFRELPSGMVWVGMIVSGDDRCADHTTALPLDALRPFIVGIPAWTQPVLIGGCGIPPQIGLRGSDPSCWIVLLTLYWVARRGRPAAVVSRYARRYRVGGRGGGPQV